MSQPLCALKGLTNGYLYVPNLPVNRMQIYMWCNDSNPARMEADQTGGASPYPNIPEFPDGEVDAKDLYLVSKYFGTEEGLPGWNYMADCVPDRMVDAKDLRKASANYGQSMGSYTRDLTGVKVVFSTGETKTPDANGFVDIPPGATHFTVYRDDTPIMALVYFFYMPPAVVKKPIMNGLTFVE